MGKGRHEYQFGVDLSLLSRYASAELLLDPSIYAARRWETGRISYTICVTVQGCGLLRRQIRESMYLTSVSLDPPGFPPFPPSHDLSGLTCQVIPLCAFGLQSEPRRDDGSAPPYSSAIVLRAGISSGDGQLRAGDPLPLRFWITVPLAARRQLKAYLKSIRLFLIDPAVVTVGGRRVVDLVGIAIREVRLEIALDAVTKNETIEVDPTLWKDCRVPPSAAESTSLHEVDRKYLLQILCEFSYDETSSSKVSIQTRPDLAEHSHLRGYQLATVLVPVAIATAGAPPGYRAVADKCQYCAGEGDLPRYEVSPIAGGEHFADGHSNMQDAWQEILR